MWNKMVISVALSVMASTAVAQTWEVDPMHSRIGFSVRHMMISNVTGDFSTYQVRVKGDPRHPDKAAVEASIDAASIRTGVSKRDEHLRSPDFFNVAKYPKMIFSSKKITRAKKAPLKIGGDLTIRGITKPVTLIVEKITPVIKDPYGKERLGLLASTVINRKDFGLGWNKALEGGGLVVGEKVTITLELELTKGK